LVEGMEIILEGLGIIWGFDCEINYGVICKQFVIAFNTLYNKEVNTTDATKYLGVAISKDLKYHNNKSKQLIVIH
jgi:hypothetical protein